jgi:hypothetical protein
MTSPPRSIKSPPFDTPSPISDPPLRLRCPSLPCRPLWGGISSNLDWFSVRAPFSSLYTYSNAAVSPTPNRPTTTFHLFLTIRRLRQCYKSIASALARLGLQHTFVPHWTTGKTYSEARLTRANGLTSPTPRSRPAPTAPTPSRWKAADWPHALAKRHVALCSGLPSSLPPSLVPSPILADTRNASPFRSSSRPWFA